MTSKFGKSRHKSWAILLDSPGLNGGNYVIFQHALYALRQGAKVTMVCERDVTAESISWHPDAKRLEWTTIKKIEGLQFDLALATWWRTAFQLHKIRSRRYAFFVQAIESRFYDEREVALRKFVESSYTLPVYFITEASWIAEFLWRKYLARASLARNGIRKDIYTPEGEAHSSRNAGRLRLLVEGPLGVARKNVERTIRVCSRSLADEIWLLTSTPVNKFPGVDKVFSSVAIQDTPAIYRSCDVLVKLSRDEGMFGPPLEMFHCGGTAVTYNVSGYEEYIVNGENALVADMNDEKRVVEHINHLKRSPQLLQKLIKGAQTTAKAWPGWEKSSRRFFSLLEKGGSVGQVGQDTLRVRTGILVDLYAIAQRYQLQLDSMRLGARIKRKLKEISPELYLWLQEKKDALVEHRTIK